MSHDPWGGGSDRDPKLRDKERARQAQIHRIRMRGVQRLLREVPEHRHFTERLATLIPVLAAFCGILASIHYFSP